MNFVIFIEKIKMYKRLESGERWFEDIKLWVKLRDLV